MQLNLIKEIIMHVLLAKVVVTVLTFIATLTYVVYVSYRPKHHGPIADYKHEL